MFTTVDELKKTSHNQRKVQHPSYFFHADIKLDGLIAKLEKVKSKPLDMDLPNGGFLIGIQE